MAICCIVLGASTAGADPAQEPAGSIRGVVYDRDFDAPLAGAQVSIVETGQKATTDDQGNYVLTQVPAGKYTLVFAKDGYVRQVRPDVLVASGRLTDVDLALAGEFTEMDEFVVEDLLQFGAGSEAGLLNMRFESPALMDSIGSDMMSRAGAGDAASALTMVAGASLQDGKSAVIRGLPDRYISSQMNYVRLPSADEDKRAVQLDQFPAPVIESIQVSKTFTPDQQGDASGGAVNIRTKGIPAEAFVQGKFQYSQNSQVANSDFLTYDGGGVDFWGTDDGGRDIQFDNLGDNWDGAVGVSEGDAPIDYKWSLAAGGKIDVGDGVKLGGIASVFYERDSSFFDDGINDSYWVTTPGGGMTPQTNQGTPQDGDFKTALFDITQGSQSVQWGGLLAAGLESENHAVNLSYFYTHSAEDTATLAEDTRGKEYYFPGYDPDDPFGTGHEPGNLNAAPYLRLETLEYTELTTGTLQLNGWDRFDIGEYGIGDAIEFGAPELEWAIAFSEATLDQPDKRQFGSLWLPNSYNPGAPPFVPPFFTGDEWFPYKPGANFNLGNLQRIWKYIEEDSQLYSLNLKLPFEQWNDEAGYLKFGIFDDQVNRTFDQDTFSNFGDSGSSFAGGWEDYWSEDFPDEDHPITASNADVDYKGDQDIAAMFGMLDLPLSETVDLIGGVRFESTQIGIVNSPESDALWFPPGSSAPVQLNPGDADVSFSQDDVLPAIGLVYQPAQEVTLRASYAQTVARQTFKELTPIIQQEFLGGPIFIGNPDLQMSELKNYDLRADYTPFAGGLVSASWFSKSIKNPIEYVQQVALFNYTTAQNYPHGELDGFEFEVRQEMGQIWESLGGLSLGANATFINSEVTLPDDEAAGFDLPGIQAPMDSREMTDAPDYIYNLYATYDFEPTRTLVGVFYTVTGETLLAGAGQNNGNFVPSIYAKEVGTLNLTVAQKIGQYLTLQVQALNLTNPLIQTVYSSPYIGPDVINTSYSKGVDYSISLSANFSF